ncbi:MAG: hypothetical protein MJZ13_06095 [Bacteroidales bacterium]|nr:hypothetical protein [Bacteroidales bacterium]
MIDFDPTTQDIIMPPDMAMRFLIWAAYFNGIEPMVGKSFADYANGSGEKMFAAADAARLDRLQVALFQCFDRQSVANSVAQLRMARVRGEQCPYSEESLNQMFGTAKFKM